MATENRCEEDDNDLQMCVMAEVCQRAEDMRTYMRSFLQNRTQMTPLNEWQRDLFSICYKETMMKKRRAMKILQNTMTFDPDDNQLKEDYQNKIFDEILSVHGEVIALIDRLLSDVTMNDDDVESKGFYVKMKADYFRYVAEVAPQEETRTEFGMESRRCYEQALAILGESDDGSTVLEVGLTLNYSVFMYEVMNDPGAACQMAEKALDKAVMCCEGKKNGDVYLRELVSLLSENVKIWSGQRENNAMVVVA